MSGAVAVRVLGGFEVSVGDAVADTGGRRQRAVLGLLISARGHVVAVDRIIDELWSGEPPPKAMAGLQT